MDISGWTLAQRMKLPDWCFGNRQVISAYEYSSAAGTYVWQISEHALPDPCCIWEADFADLPSGGGTGSLRVALSDVVPASTAEMDACQEIFPGLGIPWAGPNRIQFFSTLSDRRHYMTRQGMVTGGKKLVIEVRCVLATVSMECILVVSELPTRIPGWLVHDTM